MPSFPSGSVPTAPEWQLVVSPPVALLRQTVAQSIPTGVFTAVTFNVHDVDNYNGHSTTVNTSRYTSQATGWYQCGGGGNWLNNVNGRRGSRWAVNGVDINAGMALVGASPNAILGPPAISRLIFLNAGDYLELRAFQDSGGALNTQTSPTTDGWCMSVCWVSS